MSEQLDKTKLAAFEDFRFKIGDFVRLKAQRIEAEQAVCNVFSLSQNLRETVGILPTQATITGTIPVAMVIHRKVVQGSEGFWNYYYVKGGTWADNVWEEELELTEK